MKNWSLARILVERKITERQIVAETAEALGLKRVSVYNVITGHKETKRTRRYIARRLGVSVDEIFPSRTHRQIVAGKK